MGVDAHGPFPFPGHDSRFHGALSNSNIIHLGRSIGARFGLGDIEGLTVVVDTNVVLGELRWLAKQPGRPVLHAAVAGLSHSGVLRPVCPRLLGEEVERHLPRIAERIGVTVAALEVVWREYRLHLRFVDVVPSATVAVTYVEERDPNDVDFVHVQEGFGIDIILTKDKVLKGSPAPTAADPTDVLKALRGYEKEKRHTFALVVGGWTFALTGQVSVEMLVKGVRTLWGAFTRLPWWVQLGAGIAAAFGISRLKKQHVDWIASTLRPIAANAIRAAFDAVEKRGDAEERAAKALEVALAKVPRRSGRRPLLPTVRRALLDMPNGATDAELASAIVALGYITTSKDLAGYLTRALRRAPGVMRRDDLWHLCAHSTSTQPRPMRVASPRREGARASRGGPTTLRARRGRSVGATTARARPR